MCTLKDLCYNCFETIFPPDDEKHCKVSLHGVTVLLGFICYVTFVNKVICACGERDAPLSLLEYQPFQTHFVLLSDDQETERQIGSNSRHCPCEELTRRQHRYRQNSKVIRSVTLT